jgi:DNA-binding LacI/PurR family transcriptional regulator
VKQGYQRIGYINGEPGNMVGELRRRGYEKALKAHGRRIDKRLQFHLRLRGEKYDYQSGYEIGKKFGTLRIRPDALFVYNDLSALGFEDAVLEQGLRIPTDLAIVGFDDIERGEYALAPLSTVRQPTKLIGKEAVSLLLSLIQGKKTKIRRVLKTKLVIRESSGNRKLACAGGRSPKSVARQVA